MKAEHLAEANHIMKSLETNTARLIELKSSHLMTIQFNSKEFTIQDNHAQFTAFRDNLITLVELELKNARDRAICIGLELP